jgi:hypothetical protein
MYHIWIYPLCYSLSSPLPWLPEQSQQVSFLHLLTCVYITWTTSPTLPSPPGRTCSTLLSSDFVEEKHIKDDKKNIAFLLVWDKDSYIGRFLLLFPCTCVLQPQLIHLKQTSSLLPSPLPIVAIVASLRLLYLFLYSEHINHLQVFGFISLPYPSCVFSH